MPRLHRLLQLLLQLADLLLGLAKGPLQLGPDAGGRL